MQLKEISKLCDGQPDGPGLGALTGQNRTVWYQVHQLNNSIINVQCVHAYVRACICVYM